jgi:6-phosphogluconate dehydrogenase
MGANMATRLVRGGHELHVYDSHADAVRDMTAKGVKGATSLETLVHGMTAPRAVWLMLPAAAVDPVLDSLVPLLQEGDIVIDGGNSYYHDDIRRAEMLRAKGLHYVDVGVSGGVWGLERATAT